MVQDTGYGSELYKAVGNKDELLMYGIEETDEGNSSVRIPQFAMIYSRAKES